MADSPRSDRGPLDGHLAAGDPLSIRRALGAMPGIVRPLVDYDPIAPWEADTAQLPRALAAWRRRLRAFADRELRPRALEADAAPHRSPGDPDPFGDAVLRAAAREGYLSDLLPRPLGSADPSVFASPLALVHALKAEELAAADGGLMLTVCANALGVAPIVLAGDLRAIGREVVPAFRRSMRGEPTTFAFAITEPAGGSDVEEGHGAARYLPGVVARRVAGGFLLRGRKVYISGGDRAATITVFAALEGEGIASWSVFVVHRGDPGLRVLRNELKMGMRASGAAELEFDGLFVPDSRLIGGLRGGWSLNKATLGISRLPVAAMGVGFARAAFEEAVAFVRGTRLGRRRLIDYQDVQLTLAECFAEIQACRAMVWAAARRRVPLHRESAAAKFHCTDAARRVCTAAMDLLGNHAVVRERLVEKTLRDVRLTQIFEGTNEINRLTVIEDLQEHLLADRR
jgi:alkylation response protein AidB-like acyl-CoA dehydrogenase